jgi:hypothetical protein
MQFNTCSLNIQNTCRRLHMENKQSPSKKGGTMNKSLIIYLHIFRGCFATFMNRQMTTTKQKIMIVPQYIYYSCVLVILVYYSNYPFSFEGSSLLHMTEAAQLLLTLATTHPLRTSVWSTEM